ncbi:hypothetical protein [Nocardioides daeguensis]|uniref:Uncharacterized protein n=1 Tax=Nocardioides daeguensis TaxID=908359 RepID=A0ABP6VS15_9ACTN|nr:hypothetical protein [Nocardioides daeguensis]MBV6728486.1 hypothetical protein [Nocardioides daeguensis]MCR1773910.1 hypothetical protein [Nocardioides daeguensis]
MDLHDVLRELVTDHGAGILDDATGFRGVLDDVLAEDQATTGDINLLVDAVRFGVLHPLGEMIDGGADPARAVEEAGARLARDRGGDDQAASSWAAAVLGYAVGKVPAAVVLRYRSSRPASGQLPPPTTGPAAPYAPPATAWPPPPTTAATPTPAPAAPPPYQQPYAAPASYPPAPGGYAPPAGFGTPPPSKKKRGAGLWVAAAVAGVVVVGGGIAGAIALSGDDQPPGGKDKESSGPKEPAVDVTPAALDERYSALASRISTGTSDCEADDPGQGETEVVQCSVSTGTLRLVTYADETALTAARTARLDYRAGTLTSDEDANALYEYDPERGGTSDPALVYWDSRSAKQSAVLEGEGSATIDAVVATFTSTSPRVTEPTAPAHPKLREFIDINMDVARCTRERTFFTGETEESNCESGEDGIIVNVGRYATRKEMKADRKYYKQQYDDSTGQGGGGTWRFGEGATEGGYYAYLDESGETATLYWDWNSEDCYCYGVARNFEGDLDKLETWWPSDE